MSDWNRFELKGLDSYDLPDGKSLPEDPMNCCVGINASIGETDKDGADLFSVQFVTPTWLADHTEGWLVPEHSVVVQRFSWELVEEVITKLISATRAHDDWKHFAAEFSRYGRWEFGHPTPYEDLTRD